MFDDPMHLAERQTAREVRRLAAATYELQGTHYDDMWEIVNDAVGGVMGNAELMSAILHCHGLSHETIHDSAFQENVYCHLQEVGRRAWHQRHRGKRGVVFVVTRSSITLKNVTPLRPRDPDILFPLDRHLSNSSS